MREGFPMRSDFFFAWIAFAAATICVAAAFNDTGYIISISYILFIIYAFCLSSISKQEGIFSNLPYRHKELVGLSRFLLMFIVISTAAAPYEISKYGGITYGSVICILIAALISFDAFLLTLNIKNRAKD